MKHCRNVSIQTSNGLRGGAHVVRHGLGGIPDGAFSVLLQLCHGDEGLTCGASDGMG